MFVKTFKQKFAVFYWDKNLQSSWHTEAHTSRQHSVWRHDNTKQQFVLTHCIQIIF
jgi:hypothetical protein